MNQQNKKNLRNRMYLALWAVCTAILAPAQDLLPPRMKVEQRACTLPEYTSRGNIPVRPVSVGSTMPDTFRDTLPNHLTRGEKLYPFFERLMRNDVPVRVVHLGDSHVRGHVFTIETRHRLEQAWGAEAVMPDSVTYRTSALAVETGRPGLVYHTMGINGATTSHFMPTEKLDAIAALHPDLIILSFGTNESHGRRYDESDHLLQLDSILHQLRTRCPQAEVMLTTPPGSYIRQRRRGPRVINMLTPRVVETLQHFAAEHGLPLWDMYNIVGGKKRACLNWTNGKYMQRDRIHYTHGGYLLQGDLLAEAILKSFNDYVADRLE